MTTQWLIKAETTTMMMVQKTLLVKGIIEGPEGARWNESYIDLIGYPHLARLVEFPALLPEAKVLFLAI